MALTINNVLISEPVDPCCADILSSNGIKVTVKTGLSKAELQEEIKHYDGLVVRSATKVTADVIEAGRQLKIIGRAGVGVDNIDCEAATKCGILVINAPGGNTLSAAELTCGMIVSLSRYIPQACASLKSGKWDRKSYMGQELQGKTLAIVGLGRIGREVAQRMQSFGMKTIGFDPLVPGEVSKEFGVESMELEKLWPLADYITVHTPLIPQTKNLINDDVFSKCRKGVKIVNCARGGIVDEDALVRALDSGKCGGAGLDVYLEEPPKNTKLIQHPKVICSPHLGASTEEAQSRVAEEIALQFVNLVKGDSAHGIVNSPAFSQSIIPSNKPFISACQYLGAIAAMLFPETTQHISLSLISQGNELKGKEKLLSTAVLIGMLKQKYGAVANFINAPTIADEKGIKVTSIEIKPAMEGDSMFSSIGLVVKSAQEGHTIVTVINGDLCLLSSIDDVDFKALSPITSNLILCKAKNSPDLAAQFMGVLYKLGIVNSVSWSTKFGDYCWCAITTRDKCDKIPDDVAGYVDFWAQLRV